MCIRDRFLDEQVGLRRVDIDKRIYIYENTLYKDSKFFILKVRDKYFPTEQIIREFTFEFGLDGWSINAPNKQEIFLSDVSHSGKHSLGIKLNTSDQGWKIILSPLIPIECGNQYEWQLYVKGENAHTIYVKVAVYDSDKNHLKTYHIVSIANGKFDWKKVSFDFVPVFPDASYMQLQIWYRHETNKPLPNKIWLDDIVITLSYSIKKADETLKDMISNGEKPARIISYREVDPTRYVVRVNAKSPFILAFSETYDSLWQAEVYKNDKKIGVVKSIMLYSAINGFQVNETGDLEIVVKYKPQDLFEIGFAISTATFASCAIFLLYGFRKKERTDLR